MTGKLQYPAIIGTMGGQPYYTLSVPSLDVERFFQLIDQGDLDLELRMQRQVDTAHAKKIAKYILDNPEEYVFSAIVGSLDGEVEFEPHPSMSDHGMLSIPLRTRVLVNDGQHRIKAIAMALAAKESPETLRGDAIPVILFSDHGLTRAKRIFVALNTSKRIPTSLTKALDVTDEKSALTRAIVSEVAWLDNWTSIDRNSLSKKNEELFCFSWLDKAVNILLDGVKSQPVNEQIDAGVTFFHNLMKVMPDWEEVDSGAISAAELRDISLAGTALAIEAIALAVRPLIPRGDYDLNPLIDINWRKDNSEWEGHVISVVGEKLKIVANRDSKLWLSNYIKQKLGVPTER